MLNLVANLKLLQHKTHFKPLSEKKQKIRPRRFNSSEPYALIFYKPDSIIMDHDALISGLCADRCSSPGGFHLLRKFTCTSAFSCIVQINCDSHDQSPSSSVLRIPILSSSSRLRSSMFQIPSSESTPLFSLSGNSPASSAAKSAFHCGLV